MNNLGWRWVLVCPQILMACSRGTPDTTDATSASRPAAAANAPRPHKMIAAPSDAGAPENASANTTPPAAMPAQADGGAPLDGATRSTTDAAGSPIEVEPDDPASYLFDQTQVRTYDIRIEPNDLAKLNAQPSAETFVPAMLELEGKTYGPLGVRYKGNSFADPCTTGPADGTKAGKCSIKLGFDHVDKQGRLYGLKKLNFHSMDNDPSLLRDRLGYALFREMGVAAPRSMHARVLINGKLEGLFVAVEQVDGRFTRARFAEGGEGNLYKEVWPVTDEPSVYLEKLETNNADQPSVQAMLDFKAAIDNGPSAAEHWLDRDYMMRWLAVDRVIINDDGPMHFWCDDSTGPSSNGNYYWYQASSAEKLWLIPWDLDEAFAGSPGVHIMTEWSRPAPCGCRASSLGFSEAPSCDKLTQVFISWLDDYRMQVEKFVAGPFAAAAVDTKLSSWSAQIEPFVSEAAGIGGSPEVTDWRASVDALEAQIASAREHRGFAYP